MRTRAIFSFGAVFALFALLVFIESLAEPDVTTACDAPAPQAYTGPKVKVEDAEKSFEHSVGRQRKGYARAQITVTTRDDTALPLKGASLSGQFVGGLTAAKGEGKGVIDGGRVKVTAPGGTRIVIDSCVDAAHVRPGKYTGEILVKGGEIEQFTVPVTATIKDARYGLWALVATLGGLVGFCLRGLANVGQLVEPPPEGGRRRKRELSVRDAIAAYVSHWSYWGSVVVSIISVAGTWAATYGANETWGVDIQGDVIKLAVISFTAAVAGTSVTDLIGSFTQGGKKD